MNELTISLELENGVHLYEQIYNHIKEEIIEGKLLAGEKLPSTRFLAEHLQVSRSTVDLAYEQLSSEGYQWNVKKEMEFRKNGEYYCVSPWGLSWDDENYYLVAYDSVAEKIKHYRVDKMLHIELTGEMREGKELFERFDMAAYAKKMFGMFAGEEESVKIECHNCLAGVIIDRFGKDVKMLKKDDEHFIATVKVAVSKQFLSWVMALGNSAKIVGPERVVNQVKGELKRLIELYGE